MCQARYLKRVLSDAGTMRMEEEEAQVERRRMLWRCKEVKKSPPQWWGGRSGGCPDFSAWQPEGLSPVSLGQTPRRTYCSFIIIFS